MTRKTVLQIKKAFSVLLATTMIVAALPENAAAVLAAEESFDEETVETENTKKDAVETESTRAEGAEVESIEIESTGTESIEENLYQETETQTITERETDAEEQTANELQTSTEENTNLEELGDSVSTDFTIDSGKLVKYNGNDTQVTIPEEVTIIGKGAFKGNTTIQSVILPDNLQVIEENAFEGVPLGEKSNGEAKGTLTIPGSVTKIDYKAFGNCTGLREIIFENGSANGLQICDAYSGVNSNGVFSNCENLKIVTLPDRVTRIGSDAFYGCISLEEVVFGGNETEIGRSAFEECKTLRTMKLSDSVETIEDAVFKNCTNLSDVTLNKGLLKIGRSAFENAPLGTKTNGEATGKLIIPSTVTKIGYRAFKGCSNLREVDFENGTGNESRLEIEDGEGPYVYDNGVFSDCQNLKKVILPDRLERIGDAAFKGNCTSLEEVVFGKNLREIGTCAFYECTALRAVNLPDNVEAIEGYAFVNCTSLIDVTFNKGLRTIAYRAFENVPFGKKESGEIIGGNLVIPGSVIKIEHRAFMNCSYLKEISFENGSASVLEIEDSASNRKDWGAFAGCENLKKVILPDRLTRVGKGAFYGCTNLEEVSFGASLREIGIGSFGECKALKAVNLPDNIETIDEEAFFNCTSIVDLTLNKGLMTIGRGAFENAPLGTKENGLTLKIPGSVTSIGYRAFKDCKNLGEIIFENGSASGLIIENHYLTEDKGVFSGCENLKRVTLPDRLEVIGSSAFFGCKNLEEIIFGKNLKQINNGVLKGCTSLRAITLPNAVETIGGEAFSGCSNLTKVVLNNGLETIGELAFQGVPFGAKDDYGKLIVPGTVRTVSAGAFRECTYLQEIIFEDGKALDITLDSRGSYMGSIFYNCPELKSIMFPNRMEIIKSLTVCSCPKLENVFIPDHITTIEEKAFDNCGAFTIWGKAGSAAQTYADQYDNITFRDVDSQDNKVTGVSVTPATITKTVKDVGTKVQLIVSVDPAWATDRSVTYKTSNEKVATVDEKGEVTIVGEGSADITVTTNDGKKTAVCKVTVSKEEGNEKPVANKTIPRVVITQEAINLYEKDGEGTLRIRTTAEIEHIEYTPKLASGARLVKKADIEEHKGFTFHAEGADKSNYKKVSVKGTLTIKFADDQYADYQKDITLSANQKLPVITVSPVRTTLYPDYPNRESTTIRFQNKADNCTVTSADGYSFKRSTGNINGVTVSESDVVVVTFSKEAKKSVNLTFNVTNAKWYDGLRTTAKCTIKKGVKPELGFSNNNVVLNTNYRDKEIDIFLSLQDSSETEFIEDIKVEGKNSSAQNILANGDIRILAENGALQVFVLNSSCKKAKYTYIVTGKTSDGIDVTGTLTISVANAKPSVTYKRLGGSIDLLNREGTCFQFKPVIKNYVSTPDVISAMVLTGSNSNQFDFEYDEINGVVSVRAREGAVFEQLTTYKPTLRIALKNGEILENTISMKIKQTKPKVTVGQTSITLEKSKAGAENGQTILLMPDKDYAEIETIKLSKEDNTFDCEYLGDGTVKLFVKNNPEKKANKTYGVKFNVSFKNSAKNVKPVSVTVKVTYKDTL